MDNHFKTDEDYERNQLNDERLLSHKKMRSTTQREWEEDAAEGDNAAVIVATAGVADGDAGNQVTFEVFLPTADSEHKQKSCVIEERVADGHGVLGVGVGGRGGGCVVGDPAADMDCGFSCLGAVSTETKFNELGKIGNGTADLQEVAGVARGEPDDRDGSESLRFGNMEIDAMELSDISTSSQLDSTVISSNHTINTTDEFQSLSDEFKKIYYICLLYTSDAADE